MTYLDGRPGAPPVPLRPVCERCQRPTVGGLCSQCNQTPEVCRCDRLDPEEHARVPEPPPGPEADMWGPEEAKADAEAERPKRAVRPTGMELDTFLKDEPGDPDWLVPGLLERQDRLIVTGPEGGGKSTLLRQLAVQLASGIHPFGGKEFQPLRILLYDLENSRRQVHRKISPMRAAAGDRYKGGLIITVRAEGLDLTQGDGQLLEAEVQAAQPDVVILGPLYKLTTGDPKEEGPAKLAASWLDKIRTKYGCAVLLEAHCPHASNGAKRPIRPYGASLWMRWPEFGIYLGEDGQLSHWRGQRDEREWPALLKRGGEWPWTAVTNARELLWARIADYCTQLDDRPSIRELAQMTGSSRSSVQRAVDAHRADWDALQEGDPDGT